MKYVNKYSVGGGIVLGLILLGGLYTADIFEDKIVVTLPSDVCSDATLRVTKDDWTLKCGWRIAFQADTVVDYYKTYGTDEWVRNSRYVGVNKKDISLELVEHENYFDIIRTTKYRKGKQYIVDGVLQETYTFTKDKVKITYNYVVSNDAEHKITMRIKKQYKSYLDAFDPNGYTGFLTPDSLYYRGFGDLFIDPSVSLSTPATAAITYNEGDTVPFICNATGSDGVNMTFQWDALGTYEDNGTVEITPNESVTFSRVIPHYTLNGTSDRSITWNCEVINTSGTTAVGAANFTLNAMYKPNAVAIASPDDDNFNPLNSTGWGATTTYGAYTNGTDGYYNVTWTYPGHPDGLNINYSLALIASDGTSYTNMTKTTLVNSSVLAVIDLTTLGVDDYTPTLIACTVNSSNDRQADLCINDTAADIEIFDYSASITSGDSIRYTTQPTVTKAPALGQTATAGIITVDWLGNSYPTGEINFTLNVTDSSGCTTYYYGTDNNASAATALTNDTRTSIYVNATADPNYIWMWLTKASCGTTTYTTTYSFEVFD